MNPDTRRDAEEFVNAVRGQNDVDVLRDAPDVPVSPHGPTAAKRRVAVDRLDDVIERLDHATVSPGRSCGSNMLSLPARS